MGWRRHPQYDVCEVRGSEPKLDIGHHPQEPRFAESQTSQDGGLRQPAQLARWGNSLAVRIPLRVVETARLREGDELTLAVGKNGAIVIRPAQRKYQLAELISKITARNRHDETDWGPPLGKEAW